MKTETVKGTVETAYGNTLPSPIPFEATFEAFETIEEVRSANEYPSDKDVLNFVNAKAKANARSKATQEALQNAGIEKPTLENSPELRVNQMVKALVAAGKSEAEARQIAEAALS